MILLQKMGNLMVKLERPQVEQLLKHLYSEDTRRS